MRQSIGIDIGGTTIKAGLVDETGRILNVVVQPTIVDSAAALLESLSSIVEKVSRSGPPLGVGMGIPGLRSKDTGVIEFSPNLVCLNGVNLEGQLSERIGLPVVARNDADMYAWGEFSLGAGVGTSHMACLTLGTGVGSGLILDGHLYTGHRGYAAEAGHMVVEPDGLPCPCGGRGCLETLASATGLVALARRMNAEDPTWLQNMSKPLTAKALHGSALQGDPTAIKVFAAAGRYLGIACTNLINLLNLEMIVIGGGLSAAGELILSPARIEAEARTYTNRYSNCRIVASGLGNDAGLIGAALFFLSRT